MFRSEPEEWRQVPSVPFVSASSWGRVRIDPHEQVMPYGGVKTAGGTPTFGGWDGKRYYATFRDRTYKVARLVCEAFHGPAPVDKSYCLHRDEDSRNNLPSNLKWGTQKENLNAPGFLAYCRGRTGERNPYLKGLQRQRQEGV